ncbi:MAG TPA: DNA polymerase III subunit alpha [Ktedonobacterales bacterium]|nr:DNA polymerase III subunit alpha [Ktedonobacterales bacterium]
MTADFAHLHVHSEYSLLDGQSRMKRLIQATQAAGMDSLALTDHGGMYGSVEFYKACKAAGVKPILGVEGYLAPSLEEKTGRYEYNHLLLLAKNNTGYQNLLKLTTIAHTRGYHYRPRVDKKVLAAHGEGLIVTSGCLSGEIPEMLLKDDLNGARAAVRWYQDVFGPENFYIEVQDHEAPESPQNKLNPLLYDLHRETGAPLLATNDLHYVASSDADAQDVLLCIQTGKTLDEPKRMRFDSKQYYLKSPDEMARLFPEFPDALKNTVRVAEQCNVEIAFGANLLPDYTIPSEYPNQDTYLHTLCLEGARERFGDISDTVEQRLGYELGIIREKGLTSYFLIVWDYVNYARSHGMRCVARGSAAGSLVSYVLGITNVDPLRYVLPFERFLNPERKGLPDIDMDFPDDRREEVIRYVADKYGWDRVGQIVTFNTMAAKAAVRDVGRVMGMQTEADRVARLIPAGPKVTIDGSLSGVRDLKQIYDQSAQIRKLIDMAKNLEGTVRSTGIHAAGVVISQVPLETVVPLQLRDYKDPSNTWLVSQYEQMHIEDLGLIKFDFLGLSNLTILMNSKKFIQETRGTDIDLDRLPTDDAKTYALLGDGETTGVFQLESGAMRTYIKDLKPTCIEDVMAMVALYRPGPMDSIPQFIKAKHGEMEIRYLHPKLEPLLRESYGVIVYQDQVLLVAIELAGFSWGEVDKFRKAMSKKLAAEMAKYRDMFVKGCVKNGIDAKVADDIFSFIEPFAGYGFNKCAHGLTEIQLPDGRRMALSAAYRNPPAEIMAMWPDGQIRPHKVARIVRTGRKALLKIRTASGKTIKVTPEHRLLTTEGYREAGMMTLASELIIAPRQVNEKQRTARRTPMMARLNRSAQQRQHMVRQHTLYPHVSRIGVAAMHERVKWLFANDPEWKARLIAKSIASTRACYDLGSGYGRYSIASNGMWCASQPERDMCEWLIEQGIEFEIHKVLANGRICDFYFNGIYWELDGMDRDAGYFAEKYGDLPYVVVTPEDFRPTVLRHLGVAHAANGDPIVSIEPCGEAMTYDVEMAPDGPLNYIANGIVSHNSHACAYAWVAYQTAYLKANYTAEFMAATLTTEASDAKKVIAAIDECRRMGVEVLPPDINASDIGFTVEKLREVDEQGEPRWGVRFGLLAIKNVGSRPIEELLEARRTGGPFTSLVDLFARTDSKNLTRGAAECLVKAGALDNVGRPADMNPHSWRSRLIASLDRALTLGQQQRKMREIGQNSLFGAVANDPAGDFMPVDAPDYSRQQILAWEKDLLNIYLSAHPLAHVAGILKKRVTAYTALLNEEWAGQKITLGGRVTDVRRIMTKKGDAMAAVQLEDTQGSIEVVVFPRTYAATAERWRTDAVLLVTGTVSIRNDEPQLMADEVEEFVPTEEEINRKEYLLRIRVSRGKNDPIEIARVDQLLTALNRYPGDDRYELYVRNGQWVAHLAPQAGQQGIQFCPELMQKLEEILGTGAVDAVPARTGGQPAAI